MYLNTEQRSAAARGLAGPVISLTMAARNVAVCWHPFFSFWSAAVTK